MAVYTKLNKHQKSFVFGVASVLVIYDVENKAFSSIRVGELLFIL